MKQHPGQWKVRQNISFLHTYKCSRALTNTHTHKHTLTQTLSLSLSHSLTVRVCMYVCFILLVFSVSAVITCPPIPIWNGLVVSSVDVAVRSVVNVTCGNDTAMVGAGTEEGYVISECPQSGTWEPALPECVTTESKGGEGGGRGSIHNRRHKLSKGTWMNGWMDEWMNEWCFRPQFCYVRLYWAVWTTWANYINLSMNHALGRLLGLLTCSPARYCTTAAPTRDMDLHHKK